MTGILLGLGLIACTQANRDDAACGARCVYACLRALDLPVGSYDDLQRRLGPASRAGYSMAQLTDAARASGAQTLGVTTNLENIQRRSGRFACIVRLPPAHFVILSDVASGEAVIVDPPADYAVPAAAFQSRWDGTALLISDGPLEREEDLGPGGSSWGLWASISIPVAFLIAGGVIWIRKSAGS